MIDGMIEKPASSANSGNESKSKVYKDHINIKKKTSYKYLYSLPI